MTGFDTTIPSVFPLIYTPLFFFFSSFCPGQHFLFISNQRLDIRAIKERIWDTFLSFFLHIFFKNFPSDRPFSFLLLFLSHDIFGYTTTYTSKAQVSLGVFVWCTLSFFFSLLLSICLLSIINLATSPFLSTRELLFQREQPYYYFFSFVSSFSFVGTFFFHTLLNSLDASFSYYGVRSSS